MTRNRTLSLIALLVLVAFFGVFIMRVPRLDLSAVLVITLVLAAYDLWLQLWRPGKR